MQTIFRIPSDDMAGDARCRMPMHYYTRRKQKKLDLFFNELSIEGRKDINIDSVAALVQVYHALRKYNITTCRIDSINNQKLHEMIQGMPEFWNIKNFYFSFFRSPYESEIVENEQDEYLIHEWLYNGKSCIGLPLAVILGSAALSIYKSDWKDAFINITKDGDINTARNICIKQQVDLHIPQIQLQEEPELVESDLEVKDKKISLRSDHGIDVLMEFSKRLLRCPYVIGIINSLPFNSFERKFIKKIREDGLIEIVLPWTDKGYGVVVKTTGRTIRETEMIGKIIMEKYGGV